MKMRDDCRRTAALSLIALVLPFAAAASQASRSTCIATAASLTPRDWTAPAAETARTLPRASSRDRVPLALLSDVPLPGPAKRFDYQSLDTTTGRLYISHMRGNRLDVFDTRGGKLVASIEGFPGVTGVWAVPSLHHVYASVTDAHEVAVLDDRTLRVLARVPGADFPDGIAYAPDERRIFVSDESGGIDLVIDGVSNERLGRIDLGGEAGNTHYDAPSHCIVVAVQTRNELVAIDPASQRIVARYPMSCDHPHGFLIDEARRLAFVSCEGDARLLLVDLRTMRTTATMKVASDPDVLALDPGLGRLYVACESGALDVFAVRNGSLTSLGEMRLPYAHTVAVDPASHRVYLPLQNIDGKPVLRTLASTN